MNRKKKVALSCLIICAVLVAPAVFAVSTNDAPPASVTSEETQPLTLASLETQLVTQFPYINRALIIGSIINFVIIIFALLLYIAKRKMNRMPAMALRNQEEKNLSTPL